MNQAPGIVKWLLGMYKEFQVSSNQLTATIHNSSAEERKRRCKNVAIIPFYPFLEIPLLLNFMRKQCSLYRVSNFVI